ncbi:competence protein ComK [Niallia nealsonii]|uniref:Competence protein n=1 Tax=Niallia nealsonii TaxID=115979 RepID=A0A2N0Z706_9BACI|nr:competence protein ComK [Niallia nealsonii]PKG25273.1 competence protein [Niallia nealsonii]
MPTILPNYEINDQTLALKPSFHHKYSTIVLEGDQKLFIKQTPLQLIQQAALKGGSDYNGRRKSLIYLTGIKKKIPIPLYPQKNIYAFPTHSPNHINCHWIFFHQVESIQKHPTSTYSAKIIFKNGQELLLEESLYLLEKQMYRTWLCVKALEGEVVKS